MTVGVAAYDVFWFACKPVAIHRQMTLAARERDTLNQGFGGQTVVANDGSRCYRTFASV